MDSVLNIHRRTLNQSTGDKFPSPSKGIVRNLFWGYKFVLHNTTVVFASSLTSLAAISAQNNFQGLILCGYIYRYNPHPRRYSPVPFSTPLYLLLRSLATLGSLPLNPASGLAECCKLPSGSGQR